MVLLGIAMAGVAVVIFDAVAGPTAGWIAGGCTAVAIVLLWMLLPLLQRVTDDNAPRQH